MKRTIPELKKCRECQSQFIQMTSLHVYCSVPCSVKGTQKKREEKEARAWAVKKKAWGEDLKTWSDYYQDALKVFNEYIRLRDKDKPCISCGAAAGTYKISAGHFHPQGTYKAVAMHEDNCHAQCWYNCNKNKHGNLSEYRPRLIERIGFERVEAIDILRNTDFKPSIPELIALKVKYRKKIKALQSA